MDKIKCVCPGGVASNSLGINKAGQVVGWSDTASQLHAFLYSNGVMTDLGTLGGKVSDPFGFNDAGQVVGYSDTASGEEHAFLYSNGVMTDLNTLLPAGSGWTLEGATVINNHGLIAGYGTYQGAFHSFLLTLNSAPDLVPTSLTWDTAQGGVDFGYRVSGANLTRDTEAALYWSPTPTFDPQTATLVYEKQINQPADQTQGDHGPFFVSGSGLATPPIGATYLLLVLDPHNSIAESNETNNTASVQLPSVSPTVSLYLVSQDGTVSDVLQAQRGQPYDVWAKITNNSAFPQTIQIDWSEHYVSAPQPSDRAQSGTISSITVPAFSATSVDLGTFQHTWQWLPAQSPITPGSQAAKDLVDAFKDVADTTIANIIDEYLKGWKAQGKRI